MAIYGLKMLTKEGMSLYKYGRVHYPVGEWVNVPGNGAYVVMKDELPWGGGDAMLVQMECEEPTDANIREVVAEYAPHALSSLPDNLKWSSDYGMRDVMCFRRVKRLAGVDLEWLKSLPYKLRWAVAMYGADEHRSALLDDPNVFVVRAVAQYGNDAHRDALLHHPNEEVRWMVAQYGNNEHRDILLHDPERWVRRAVAYYGTEAQRDAVFYRSKSWALRAVVWFRNKWRTGVEEQE